MVVYQDLTNIIEHMELLNMAALIRKLLKEKKYQTEYTHKDLKSQSLMLEKKKNTRKRKRLRKKNSINYPPTKKFAHLAEYYGKDGILDLNTANIPA
ncbi:hypothetical protein BDF21DRAFT_487135 [Thamnidium elegans]|nr:hypothetical protein BDF21DRAFT_487135 [Thamnidium elegans]